jgi:hypothetical protein
MVNTDNVHAALYTVVSEQSCPLFICKPTPNTTTAPLASGRYFIERSSLPLVETTEVRHGREPGMVLRKRATRACLVPPQTVAGRFKFAGWHSSVQPVHRSNNAERVQASTRLAPH